MTELAPRWPLGGWKRLGHALACVAAFELLQGITFTVAFKLLHLSWADVGEGRVGLICWSAFQGGAIFVCVVWLAVVKAGRVSWRDLGWSAESIGRSLGKGALGALLLVAAVGGTQVLLGNTVAEIARTSLGYTAAQRALFVVIGLQAATVEESIFRGYLQPALISKFGLVAGVLICAGLFGLLGTFMARPSALIFCSKFSVALVLGALRGRDRSLLAPMLAHFVTWPVFGFM